jgi:hypothetical protein
MIVRRRIFSSIMLHILAHDALLIALAFVELCAIEAAVLAAHHAPAAIAHLSQPACPQPGNSLFDKQSS